LKNVSTILSYIGKPKRKIVKFIYEVVAHSFEVI